MKGCRNHTINVRGQLISLDTPRVMGILNATPDSFYNGSRTQTEADIASRANQIVSEGGSIIDIGAFSTHPGATQVPAAEEEKRLRGALNIVRCEQPNAVVSVDTFRPGVARMAVEEFGVDIINDVSEGGITGIVGTPLPREAGEYPAMFRLVARLRVPYVLMSVQSNLIDMMISFSREIQQLRDLGAKDIILDPGFGFGKTLDENYKLLGKMDMLMELDLPLLVGVSRKRMIYDLIGGDPSTSLNATTSLNTVAMLKGANILRVHDVREAVEAVEICGQLSNNKNTTL